MSAAAITEDTKPWVPAEDFGLRLVMVRRHLGLTQRDAAEACDITQAAWNRWENGKLPRNMGEVVRTISSAFGVDRDWLMWGAMPSSVCFTADELVAAA